MEQADKDRETMHTDQFNPHEGLWAESKQNTQFRKDTTKWRSVMGAGFVGLFVKHIYDMFT